MSNSSGPQGHLVRRGASLLRRVVALHPWPFAMGVTGATVYAGAMVASSWVLGRVVDEVVVPRFADGTWDRGRTGMAATAIIAVGIIKAFGIVARRLGAMTTSTLTKADVRRTLLARYRAQPLAFHRAHRAGELIAHVGSDADSAVEVVGPLPYTTGVATLLVVTAVWLVLTDPVLAIVALLLVPAILLLNARYQAHIEDPATRAQQHVGDVSAVAHESFDGALVVQALGLADDETARFAHEAERLRDAQIEVARIRSTFEAMLDALPSIATAVLVLLGAWRVDQRAITPGQLVAFVNLFTIMVVPLRLIGYLLGDMARSVVADDRIQRVMAEPLLDVATGTDEVPAGAADLRVEGLTAGYEDGPPVITDISFAVPAGATVAIVGPTGSGKSTLLLALAGLLPPSAGTVALAGRDLRTIDRRARTQAIAVAFQEAFLFGDTVAENIALDGDGAVDIDATLRLARADGFVGELPKGTATVLGERGATLSGGQRQRLALARALARRPRLLLLDEATASVDPVTEAAILSGLRRHLRGTTTVLVASRPSTIAIADAVLFVEGGRIVASGTHDKLLRTNKHYARLVRAYEQARAG